MLVHLWKEAQKDDRAVSILHKMAAVWLKETSKPLTGKVLDKTLLLTRRVTDFLDENGVAYWMESGTLLGIIRENRLLPWDHDVDISMEEKDLQRIEQKMKYFRFRYGYRVEFVRNTVVAPPLVPGSVRLIKVQSRRLFVLPGYAQLDLFVKTRHDGQLYWSIRNKALKSAPVKFTDNLIRRDFENMKLSVPEDNEGYLAYRFGDWKTPLKDYDNIADDKSVVKELKG